MTFDEFQRAAQCSAPRAAEWCAVINAAMDEFVTDTPRHRAAFIAQVSHESARFTRFEEGLNYSAQRLMQVWPRRFKTLASTRHYANNPEELANHVYANRMGNGPEESGDGWLFRGRGPLQITGRDNYTRCGDDLGLPLHEYPDMLLEPLRGAHAAGWFWSTKGCNRLMDLSDFEGLTRRINGGLHGYNDRLALFEGAMQELA